MSKYTLVNAYKMHCENPTTFEIPTVEQLQGLKVGDDVKLCFNNLERMWVKITKIDSLENMEGTLNNDPAMIRGLKYGDPIKFKACNIYSIYE